MPSIELGPNVDAQTVAEISVEAVVTRCGCQGDWKLLHEHLGGDEYGPCPTPRAVENRGVVAFRSNNPFKQLVWTVKQTLKGRRA